MVWASHLALQHLSVHPYGPEINAGHLFFCSENAHYGGGMKKTKTLLENTTTTDVDANDPG